MKKNSLHSQSAFLLTQVILSCLCFIILVSPAHAQTAPHGTTNGIALTIARSAANHRPIGPTTEFKETVNSVALTFQNKSGSFQHTDINIIAQDVEGYQKNSKFSGGWIQTPRGQWNSLTINAPRGGFSIGTYRIELDGRRTASFEVVSRFDTARLLDADQDFGRPNIALKAIGGKVQVSSTWQDDAWQSAHLIDGRGYTKALGDGSKCDNCGWAARQNDRRPWVIVGFRDGQSANISEVVVDLRRFVPPNTYFNQVSDNFPKLVKLSASNSAGNSDFKEIGTFRLRREFLRHAIALEEPVSAKALKLEILETYGDTAVIMELEVYEAEGSGPSIAQGKDVNIALPALGGASVTYSGFNDKWTASRLFDDDAGTSWQSYDRYFPQDFTIAFNKDRIAKVERLELAFSKRTGTKSWPSEIAIAVSETSPIEGFREIGRFPVSSKSDVQSFPVGQKAKYIKLRVLDNNGADRTTISEFRVFEEGGLSLGSVLFSDQESGVDNSTASIVANVAPNEVEPNDDLNTAMVMGLEGRLIGKIDPLGEQDVFEIPDLGEDARALTLQYDGIPNIRHRIELLGQDGKVLSAFDPGDLPSRNAELTFRLNGAEKYLRLSEPPASVVVIWDTSGSMKGSEADLERAVRQYIRRAPTRQSIQLIRFSDEVEVLTHGFSTNKAGLANRLNGNFRPEGGTSLYDAISRGLDLLETREGNKAILVMTDGAHNGRMWHNDLWQQVENSQIRIYTIGLGNGLEEYSPVFASTGNRILRHFSHATNGDSFFAANSSALADFYRKIADDLSKPATYILTPSVERGSGQLQVLSIGEEVPSAAMPDLNLVFDISGSMVRPTANGRSRIDVGRASWRSTSETIPQGAPFKLMLYGAKLRESDGKERACTDIETVFEGDFNRREITSILDRQRPRSGTTPLVGSIEAAVQSAQPGTILVVITDGKDECAEDPVARMQKLYLNGADQLNINIIGFDVGDPDVESSIRAMASAIHAEFYLAENAEDLSELLADAFAAPYKLVDSGGVAVVEGKIGRNQVSAPAGTYTLEIDAGSKLHRFKNVRIGDNLTTTITVNKVGAEMDVSVGSPKVFDPLHECGVEASKMSWTVKDVQEKLIDLVSVGLLPSSAHPGSADNSVGPKTRNAVESAGKHLDLPPTSYDIASIDLVQNLYCLDVAKGKFRPEPSAR